MLLAEGLVHHEGPLLASMLAEYRINLRNHSMSLRDLSDLVAALPPGCAFWRSFGGPMSWTTADHVLHELDFDLRVLAWQQTEDGRKNRNRPERVEQPKFAHQRRADAERIESRANAYLRRQRQNIN